MTEEGRCGPLSWAVCASAYPGQARSGDAYLVRADGAGVLVAVVDGLGHGAEAAEVAETALASVRASPGRSLVQVLTACHGALRGSRGVVMTLVAYEPHRSRLRWLAVGNVDAAVLRRGGGAAGRWSVPLRGGVVGDRLPPLLESTVDLVAGDTLVAATDGLSPAFLDGIDLSRGPPELARALHRAHARGDDDALVLVARYGTGTGLAGAGTAHGITLPSSG